MLLRSDAPCSCGAVPDFNLEEKLKVSGVEEDDGCVSRAGWLEALLTPQRTHLAGSHAASRAPWLAALQGQHRPGGGGAGGARPRGLGGAASARRRQQHRRRRRVGATREHHWIWGAWRSGLLVLQWGQQASCCMPPAQLWGLQPMMNASCNLTKDTRVRCTISGMRSMAEVAGLCRNNQIAGHCTGRGRSWAGTRHRAITRSWLSPGFEQSSLPAWRGRAPEFQRTSSTCRPPAWQAGRPTAGRRQLPARGAGCGRAGCPAPRAHSGCPLPLQGHACAWWPLWSCCDVAQQQPRL